MKHKIRDSVVREMISYDGEGFVKGTRELVEEINLQIYVNHGRVGELACSPWDTREAVIGFLYMKGYLSSYENLKEIHFSEEGNVFAVTENIHINTKEKTACDKQCECMEVSTEVSEEMSAETSVEVSGEVSAGVSVEVSTEASAEISAEEIIKLAKMLEDGSKLFHRTGGVHCAALARNGEFIVYKEDVSRHVAVDKVVGVCLAQGIPMDKGVLVFSGRVPAEIMQKVAAMGCGMIIARSAPTDYACRMAEEAGITLVAFARDNKFNIYTHPERVFGGDEK